jgi:translation initiation factor IF-3
MYTKKENKKSMEILLIGETGQKIGSMGLEEARKIAKDAGKDLIIVNAKKNIYRMADAGKLKYEQKQKDKKQRSQRRTHKVKEIKLRLLTERHDMDVKIRHIKDFLSRGLKTKVTMQLKGRQRGMKDIGINKMNELIANVVEGGLATVDKMPTFDGSSITAFLSPSK